MLLPKQPERTAAAASPRPGSEDGIKEEIFKLSSATSAKAELSATVEAPEEESPSLRAHPPATAESQANEEMPPKANAEV